jgi:prepilin-type N-terminal cleavage/methylation domain-containing protein
MSLKHRQAFSLIELIFVVLLMGMLSVVAAMSFRNLKTDANVANVRHSLKVIQNSIDAEFARTGKFPTAINPRWFLNNQLPRHPLAPAGSQSVHVFVNGDRVHPAVKQFSAMPAYWYNSNNGVVRARVPAGTQKQVVDAYNLYNGTKVTTYNQTHD